MDHASPANNRVHSSRRLEAEAHRNIAAIYS
jgi:hypothetical protein